MCICIYLYICIISIQFDSASTDVELQAVLVKPLALDILSDIGYRGVPTRETLSSKTKLIRLILYLFFHLVPLPGTVFWVLPHISF